MPTNPNLVADAVAYADGVLLTSVESVELPDVEMQTEDYEKLGMTGTVTLPMHHVAPMTATINFSSYDPADQRAFVPGRRTQLEVRTSIGDMGDDGSLGEFGRKITLGCMPVNRSNDSAERRRAEAVQLEVAVHYYKEEIDGELIYEIDPVNRVLVYAGEDLLEDRRANLGL